MRLKQRVCTIVAAAFICGLVFVGRPASAQTQIQAGQVVTSEFRLRGPAGAEDEFVELYNNTDQPITVQALDGSNGWSVVISNGQITGTIFTVPNGTVIPARGHLLGGNSNGYSLCNYPSGYGPTSPTPTPTPTASPCIQNGVGGTFTHTTPDRTWDFDVSDGSGVALFATTNGTNFTAATRLDAAGFTTSPALYREGGGIASVVTANTEHTYYRDLRTGLPKDTSDNASDFLLVGTAPNIQIPRLGAPGPENLASPIVNNTTIIPTLLDPSVASSSPPNRGRTFALEPNGTFGTLVIRRTITNNTGQPVSRLRFRVINITTFGTPGSECGGTCADVRALTSAGGTATVGGQPVPVLGLRLEEPPEQPAGGGYNASLSADTITLGTPLPDGQSINVEFKLGIERTGSFRFFVNTEAQNGSQIILTGPAASDVGANGRTDSKQRRLIADTVESAPRAPATPAAPATPTTAPAAAPRNVYVPWLINLTPPASERTHAAEEERDKEDKEDEGKEKKSSEEATPSTPPAPQAPEASAPDSAATAADDEAPQSSPETMRRGSAKKVPAAAKSKQGGKQ